MAQRVGGLRRKTRRKFKKNIRTRGKISMVQYFQTFESGEKVVLKANTAVQKGMYHARFHGEVGTIKQKQGRCFEVVIKDGGMMKKLIIHPIHLQKCQTQ
ncbi:50S ribosomal protein L21e [archaeon]|nr:50S ribosomal protein L21e [archaeon]|tara:strand:- start:1382 stop:1681 length:300 start_codon:yes stop_codon:yes gene_type:complete